MKHSSTSSRINGTNGKQFKAGTATRDILGSPRRSPTAGRNIESRWAGQYRMLVLLRNRLASDRTGALAEAAQPLERHSMSPADSASDVFDHDQLLRAISTEQDMLFEVDEAIRRIENQTYGICELTGRAIPRERLRAIPWTRFTVEAEQKLEDHGAVRYPHLGDLHTVHEGRTRIHRHRRFG